MTATPAPAASEPRWRVVLRALRHRNYRLFLTGQGLSLMGTWMTRVAIGWLVYRLTHSAFLLGIVSFSGQVPALLLGPFAGVWVDRWNRHRVLLATQVCAMCLSLSLAGLALGGVVTVRHLIVISLLQGLVNAVDMPTRQAFFVQMVDDRNDLGNAIALNASMTDAMRMVGPALAGIIIATVGEGYCFLLDGVSYFAIIGSLLAMRIVHAGATGRRAGIWTELREGWRYVAGFRPVWMLLLMLAIMALLGMPYLVLMPIFAGTVLHGGPQTMGWLTSAIGLGAMIGAITLAARKSVLGLGRVVAAAALAFGVALIAFSASRLLWLSLPLLAVCGYGMVQLMAGCNTLLQTVIDDEKRGRVMGFYAMAWQGMVPFGSLLGGATASRIGAPHTLMIGGGIIVLSAGVFAAQLPAIRRIVRPIYMRMGIIPEVAGGIQAATLMETPPEE